MLARIMCMVVIALNVGGCATTVTETRRNQIMEQTPELNPTRTWCIGRYLVDLPASMMPVARYEGDGITKREPIGSDYGNEHTARFEYWDAQIMPTQPMTREAFKQFIRDRQEELRKAKHKKGQGRLLQTAHPAEDIYVLATWEDEISRVMNIIEGYRWLKGFRFFIRQEVSAREQAEGIEEMQTHLNNLRALAVNEIPEEAGFCFPGGMILGKLKREEETDIYFMFGDHLDVTLEIKSFPNYTFDKPLLERTPEILRNIDRDTGGHAYKIKTLRKADRPLAGLPGQEWLVSYPDERGGNRAQGFDWEYQGGGKWEKPHLTLELMSGKFKRASTLSDEQAITLWDAILNSFRERPIKPNKPEAKAD